MEIYLGVLSGTSLDAIDIVAVNLAEPLPQILYTDSYALPDTFKQQCLNITQTGTCHIQQLGTLDATCGLLFAEAILKSLQQHHLSPDAIQAIGSHGITLYHAPEAEPAFTLQIGDPNTIAEKTGICTIADFRRRDIAAEGHGAPLASILHQAIFASNTEDHIIVNVGGIANITVLPMQHQIAQAFDTGPGNCLIDDWMKKHFNQPFDQQGKLGQQGQLLPDLLHALQQDPFFHQAPPKSTGREYFHLSWLEEYIAKTHTQAQPIDILHTLYALTINTIANAISNAALPNPKIYICGGGAENTFLTELLSTRLQAQVLRTDHLGIPSNWVEGVLFALLAKKALYQEPCLLPNKQGQFRHVLLGGIYQQPIQEFEQVKIQALHKITSVIGTTSN